MDETTMLPNAAKTFGFTSQIGPVMVGRDETTASAHVGRTIYFYGWADPTNTTITADNLEVIKLYPGKNHGTWLSTPCAEGRLNGVANVTITPSSKDPNQRKLDVKITIA